MMKFENLVAEKTGFHLACIFAVIFIVFGNSLFFDFVWDDRPLLLELDVYKEFRLKDMLFSPANGLEYLPVRDISYGLDYFLWGRNPAGFHFTNIVLYSINCFFVYFLSLELTSFLMRGAPDEREIPSRMTAFFTTLLFAVHPIHSEVVSFITCRNVLLSGLFFFMSCYFYLKFMKCSAGEGKKYYVISLCGFVLAILSKAPSIILPLLLMLFLMFRREKIRKSALSLIPFFIVSLAAFFMFKTIAGTSKMISDHTMVFGAFSFVSKLAVALQIPFFYISKMILPVKLSAEYMPEFSQSPGNIKALSSLSALIFTGAGVLIYRKRYQELIFSFAWFMITLLPVMNFFRTHPVVADRYVYLSSYAFVFIVVVFLLRVFNSKKWRGAMFIIPVIAAALSLLSVERNSIWKTEKTLWEDTVIASPRSFKAHSNLGAIYFNEGNAERAFSIFDKLKEIEPSSVIPDYYRGLQRFKAGDFQGTIALLRNGDTLDINYLLGRSYEITGNIEKAIESYMNILKSIDLDVAGRRDFARQRLVMLRMTISSELDVMRKRIKENASDLNERIKLAVALDKAGLFDEAIEQYNELERLGGDNWALFYNMANVYKKTDNYEKAVFYYRKSLELNSKNADAYNNLALEMKKLRKYDLAIKAFEDAISADNNYAYAPFNLAVLYFHLGDKENALKYFNFVQKRFPDFKGRVVAYLSKIEK